MARCRICGIDKCDKHVFSIGNVREIKNFSGSSPPEIFIGKWNYPNVYTGILSPMEHGDTKELSSPEVWHERKMSVNDILINRDKLIYGRTQSNIKKIEGSFLSILKEVAMTHKSIATEFELKKPVMRNNEQAPNAPLIAHSGEVEKVRLQENTHIKPKVDYIVNDTCVDATRASVELSNSGIETSSIIKLLSAGLLGKGNRRKLVPTRWSITAVDDILSKEKLGRIRFYKELDKFEVFNAEYLGNHYEFILMPGNWSFEVIEISLKNFGVWKDREGFNGRKSYADDVTGAYYANRLAVSEYLERIQRQANVIVLREIRPEYTSPLGVGILRQTSREAFSKKGEVFDNLSEALLSVQARMRTLIEDYTSKSSLLKNYGKQKKLGDYF